MHLTLLIVSLISLFQQRLDSYIFLIISSVKYPLCRSAHPILLWLLASQPGFGPGVQQFDLAPRACKLSIESSPWTKPSVCTIGELISSSTHPLPCKQFFEQLRCGQDISIPKNVIFTPLFGVEYHSNVPYM